MKPGIINVSLGHIDSSQGNKIFYNHSDLKLILNNFNTTGILSKVWFLISIFYEYLVFLIFILVFLVKFL